MDNRTLKMKADQYRDLRARALELYRDLSEAGYILYGDSPSTWEFRKTEVVKL